MAICPFAELRLLPDNRTQPAAEQRVWLAHSIVGSAASAYGYFLRSTSLESHFILRKDGSLIQCIDTAKSADANYHANRFAISVETEDNGHPDTDPWTEAQLYTLVRHGVWSAKAHPLILPQRVDKWDGSGFGFHTIFGAPSHYTPVAKSCPGAIRKVQFEQFVLPGILKGLAAKPSIPAPGAPPVATITDQQIVWYTHTAPITRKVTTHAYCRYPKSGIAKWLKPAGLATLRNLHAPEVAGALGVEFQQSTAILDGPCKNV